MEKKDVHRFDDDKIILLAKLLGLVVNISWSSETNMIQHIHVSLLNSYKDISIEDTVLKVYKTELDKMYGLIVPENDIEFDLYVFRLTVLGYKTRDRIRHVHLTDKCNDKCRRELVYEMQ